MYEHVENLTMPQAFARTVKPVRRPHRTAFQS